MVFRSPQSCPAWSSSSSFPIPAPPSPTVHHSGQDPTDALAWLSCSTLPLHGVDRAGYGVNAMRQESPVLVTATP